MENRGQTSVEYLLMLSILTGVVLVVGVALKQFMPSLFNDISNLIASAGIGSGGTAGGSSGGGSGSQGTGGTGGSAGSKAGGSGGWRGPGGGGGGSGSGSKTKYSNKVLPPSSSGGAWVPTEQQADEMKKTGNFLSEDQLKAGGAKELSHADFMTAVLTDNPGNHSVNDAAVDWANSH